ncbi:MAG: geranylgeranyl reductase family protein [Legionella sp.]|nr:geranylgeranyl reductase family protein [Legionella sp.]
MFDVMIVGAGPSGSSCAYNLKRFNPSLKILLVDKATFPRYKTCGGGVSPDVFNYFDFDLSEVIDYRCKQSVMVINQARTETDVSDVLMVRREVFDDFLLKKAVEKGVEVYTNCEVEAVTVFSGQSDVLVKTSRGEFSSKIVVLAEGARGKLAKNLGIAAKNTVVAGIEYEHYTNKLDSKLEINFDQGNSFYAWNFPKSDGLSLGVGALIKGKQKKGRGLPQQLKNYVKQFDVDTLDRKHQHGHPIALYSGRSKLVHDRIILIGEVAGCVDPLTAEGIRPAIKSGYLAAEVLNQAFKKNHLKSIKKYNKIFHQNIGKDFQYARLLAYFLQKKRDIILPLLNSKHAIDAFMRVFSGDAKYSDYISKKRIFKLIKKGVG